MPSLYRKWRSRSFDDLIGQEHVVQTLRNAVRQGRVAHAYLFTGPRGTGKTSTARILAKAVNCLSPREGNPCNECEACGAADAGRAIDVIEIDAASNTSVENVRELRERVAYAAGEGRFKVYIVDEVHRLSGAAFDAFLKTLEEPPAHVVFVFASTEPQKVPATIASRCQRFDFKRIAAADVLRRIRYVAEQEAIEITDGALELIARYASGSLRDGLGLLEQVSSFVSGTVRETDVRDSLGLSDPLVIARLTDSLIAGDVGAGLSEAESHFTGGGDPKGLLRQLVDYWRALLLVVSGAGREAASVDPSLEAVANGHAAVLDAPGVLAVLRALTSSEINPRYDHASELAFEIAFVGACLALPRRDTRERPLSAATKETETTVAIGTAEASAPTPDGAADTVAVSPVRRVEDTSGEGASPGEWDLDEVWARIVERMRSRSLSLQAVLRGAGYLLEVGDDEVTIGFLYDFHRNQFADNAKRRQLEDVIGEVMGGTYRARVVHTSKQEIEAARGAGAAELDDGFIEEAADRLREYHVKQIGNPSS